MFFFRKFIIIRIYFCVYSFILDIGAAFCVDPPAAVHKMIIAYGIGYAQHVGRYTVLEWHNFDGSACIRMGWDGERCSGGGT